MSEGAQIADKMKAIFKDIANPDQQPQQFLYQVKLARYELYLESLTGKETESTESN